MSDRHQWRLRPGRNDELDAFGGLHGASLAGVLGALLGQLVPARRLRQDLRFFGRTLGDLQCHANGTGGVELFARTNLNGGGGGTTSLGTGLLGAFHRYRIDWNADSVDYYVDGKPVAHHALTVAGPMRPVAASDFDEFGGTVFVDWMRMTPNATPGVFVSRVFDANVRRGLEEHSVGREDAGRHHAGHQRADR